MGSISCHITPLVINSPGGRQTHSCIPTSLTKAIIKSYMTIIVKIIAIFINTFVIPNTSYRIL